MDNVRFGWIGDARRAVLLGVLSTLVEDWASNWWCGCASGAPMIAITDEMDAQGRLQGAYIARSVVGATAIHVGAHGTDAIGRHLAATVTDEDTELAAQVGEQALCDLAAGIHARAGAAATPSTDKTGLTPDLLDARLGAFAISVALGRLSIVLLIDRQLGERLAPSLGTNGPPLKTRHGALSHAPVRLTAVLPFGVIDLVHLSDLAIGEVLVGDRKLEDTLHIHVEGKAAVAAGFMRRIGERRAVMLDSAIAQETSRHD